MTQRDLLLDVIKGIQAMEKLGFVPPPPPDPSMTGGPGMPPGGDPAAGGMPGLPPGVDPAMLAQMMGGAGVPAGAPPVDPMAGGMPPPGAMPPGMDPTMAAGPGMPPPPVDPNAGSPVMLQMSDLEAILKKAVGDKGGNKEDRLSKLEVLVQQIADKVGINAGADNTPEVFSDAAKKATGGEVK